MNLKKIPSYILLVVTVLLNKRINLHFEPGLHKESLNDLSKQK